MSEHKIIEALREAVADATLHGTGTLLHSADGSVQRIEHANVFAPPKPQVTEAMVERAFREMEDVQHMADLHVDNFKSYLRAALEAALIE